MQSPKSRTGTLQPAQPQRSLSGDLTTQRAASHVIVVDFGTSSLIAWGCGQGAVENLGKTGRLFTATLHARQGLECVKKHPVQLSLRVCRNLRAMVYSRCHHGSEY